MKLKLGDRTHVRKSKRFKAAVAATLAAASIGVWLNVSVMYSDWKSDTKGYMGEAWVQAAQYPGAPETVERTRANYEHSLITDAKLIKLLPRSAYVDTLKAIFGKTKIGFAKLDAEHVYTGAEGGVLAQYVGISGRVVLKRPEGEPAYMYRAALTHEFVHAWQSKQPALLNNLWAKYEIRAPLPKMANYASHSKSEHQAEAAAAAVGFLNVLNQNYLKPQMKVALGKYLDSLAPGTLIMTRVLLSHPLYAHHAVQTAPLEGLDLTPITEAVAWEGKVDKNVSVVSGRIAANPKPKGQSR